MDLDGEYVLLDSYHDQDELPYVYVKKNGRFLDVGAGTGVFAGQALEHCSLVVAIEPYSLTRRTMEESAKGLDRIVILKEAVSHKAGEAPLFEGGPTLGALDSPGKGLERVPVTTLDAVWDKYGPFDTVKMDIEGGEYDALKGGKRLLEAGVVLCIEVHSIFHPDRVCYLLEKEGYKVDLVGFRRHPTPSMPHYIVATTLLEGNSVLYKA